MPLRAAERIISQYKLVLEVISYLQSFIIVIITTFDMGMSPDTTVLPLFSASAFTVLEIY